MDSATLYVMETVNEYSSHSQTTDNMKSTAQKTICGIACSIHQYLHLSMTVTVKELGHGRLSQ